MFMSTLRSMITINTVNAQVRDYIDLLVPFIPSQIEYAISSKISWPKYHEYKREKSCQFLQSAEVLLIILLKTVVYYFMHIDGILLLLFLGYLL